VNVPVNAVIQLQVNEPVDAGTVDSNTFLVEDGTTGQAVAGSYSVSADERTISFLPSAPLGVSRLFFVNFVNRGITDLAGNLLGCVNLCNYSFTTSALTQATGPAVVGISPANGLTGIPINARVEVQFSEPVDALTVSQVTVTSGGVNVNVTSTLTNANQTLTLVPVVALNANTSYTVTVTGVQDLSGNGQVSPFTSTFTTGGGADLIPLAVVAVTPANAATGVPTNASVQVKFNKRIDALTVTNSTFVVAVSATGIPINGTIAVSADGLTATFTPSAILLPVTTYQIVATSAITDLVGQATSSSTIFTTQ